MPPDRNDVQLENGHVRIANRLLEAVLATDKLHATQIRILLALIRLTYGWRRKTVRIRQADLAAAAGVKYSGSFRLQLQELIDEHVVLEVEASAGGRGKAPLYALQKDFSRWGRFAVAPSALASPSSAWGTRPESDDALLPSADDDVDQEDAARAPAAPFPAPLTAAKGSEIFSGDSCPPEGIIKPASPEAGKPVVIGASPRAPSGLLPFHGQRSCLQEGSIDPPKDTGNKELGERKDRKDTSSSATTSPAADSRPPKGTNQNPTRVAELDAFRLALVIAANQGIAANEAVRSAIGGEPTPLVHGHSAAYELAEQLLDRRVPLDWAKGTIYELAENYRPDPRQRRFQPSSLKYFERALLEAWEREQAGAAAASSPRPSAAPKPGAGSRDDGRYQVAQALFRIVCEAGLLTAHPNHLKSILAELVRDGQVLDGPVFREWVVDLDRGSLLAQRDEHWAVTSIVRRLGEKLDIAGVLECSPRPAELAS